MATYLVLLLHWNHYCSLLAQTASIAAAAVVVVVVVVVGGGGGDWLN